MVAVDMIEASCVQIVKMIAMRDQRRTISKSEALPRLRLDHLSGFGIHRAHRDRMLLIVIAMRYMEVPIMQIGNLSLMLDRNMPAIGAMDMVMPLMGLFVRQGSTGDKRAWRTEINRNPHHSLL